MLRRKFDEIRDSEATSSGAIASRSGDRMKLPKFPTLLVSLKLGRPLPRDPTCRRPADARAQHTGWVRPLVALGGVTCTLLSPSYGEEQVRQHVNAASGQLVFNNTCRTCHTTKEGDNRLGPHLFKIVGRKAGSLPDYGYSGSLRSADFVWDEENLDRFIANPDEMVPGNRMKPYSGLASIDDRARIVSFLRSVASDR
jgi:cytochrome c